MFLEYSISPHSAFYHPKSAVYVIGVLFMSLEDSLCPQSSVYVPKVHFMSLEYYLCP